MKDIKDMKDTDNYPIGGKYKYKNKYKNIKKNKKYKKKHHKLEKTYKYGKKKRSHTIKNLIKMYLNS